MALSRWEIEARLLYALLVAGKTAKFAEDKVVSLLALAKESETPFQFLKQMIEAGALDSSLKDCRTGNYGKLAKAIPEIIKLNPSTCTLEELESIHGIGPKTSRFFLMWTRPGVRYAALDTHILKWLRSLGHDAPKSTPTGNKYLKLEKIFLAEADKRGVMPRDLDFQIWEQYSKVPGQQMEINELVDSAGAI